MKKILVALCLVLATSSSLFGYTNREEMALPVGKNVYQYSPVREPVLSVLPSLCEPIGIGDVRRGTFNLQIALPKFAGAVDVYLQFQTSDRDIYVIKPDSSFERVSTKPSNPWLSNFRGPINQSLYGEISLAEFTVGRYYISIVVTNVSRTDDSYKWTTYFDVSPLSLQSSANLELSIIYPCCPISIRVGSILALQTWVRNSAILVSLTYFIDDVAVEVKIGVPQLNSYIFFHVGQSLTPGLHIITIRGESVTGNIETASATFIVEREIRRDALQFLKQHNAGSSCRSSGSRCNVYRWSSLPIIIEVSPLVVQNVSLEMIRQAVNIWTMHTGITFEVRQGDVDYISRFDGGREGVVYIQINAQANADLRNANLAGYTSTAGSVDDFGAEGWYILTRSLVDIGIESNYTPEHYQYVVAHEIGHSLGILNHTSNGLMASGSYTMEIDAVNVEAMRILYFELHPGDVIPND